MKQFWSVKLFRRKKAQKTLTLLQHQTLHTKHPLSSWWTTLVVVMNKKARYFRLISCAHELKNIESEHEKKAHPATAAMTVPELKCNYRRVLPSLSLSLSGWGTSADLLWLNLSFFFVVPASFCKLRRLLAADFSFQQTVDSTVWMCVRFKWRAFTWNFVPIAGEMFV